MLRVETMQDGEVVVRFYQDWTPGRIGQLYTPKQSERFYESDYYDIQAALLQAKN